MDNDFHTQPWRRNAGPILVENEVHGGSSRIRASIPISLGPTPNQLELWFSRPLTYHAAMKICWFVPLEGLRFPGLARFGCGLADHALPAVRTCALLLAAEQKPRTREAPMTNEACAFTRQPPALLITWFRCDELSSHLSPAQSSEGVTGSVSNTDVSQPNSTDHGKIAADGVCLSPTACRSPEPMSPVTSVDAPPACLTFDMVTIFMVTIFGDLGGWGDCVSRSPFTGTTSPGDVFPCGADAREVQEAAERDRRPRGFHFGEARALHVRHQGDQSTGSYHR